MFNSGLRFPKKFEYLLGVTYKKLTVLGVHSGVPRCMETTISLVAGLRFRVPGPKPQTPKLQEFED